MTQLCIFITLIHTRIVASNRQTANQATDGGVADNQTPIIFPEAIRSDPLNARVMRLINRLMASSSNGQLMANV